MPPHRRCSFRADLYRGEPECPSLFRQVARPGRRAAKLVTSRLRVGCLKHSELLGVDGQTILSVAQPPVCFTVNRVIDRSHRTIAHRGVISWWRGALPKRTWFSAPGWSWQGRYSAAVAGPAVLL